MRFTIEDLQRGIVSEARIREVVNQSALEDFQNKHKSDKQLTKQIKKDLKFNPVKLISNPNILKGPELNKYFNNIIFFSKLQEANLKLIQREFQIIVQKQEKLLKAYIQLKERMEKLKEEARNREQSYVAKMQAQHKQQLDAMMAEYQRMDNLLAELNNQRAACDRAIQAINRSIAISREMHIREALNTLDGVMVDGKPLFENNSLEQKEAFVRDVFKAQEKYTRTITHIDNLINKELKEQNQSNGMSSFGMHKQKSSPKIRELEQQKTQAKQTMYQEIRETADRNQVQALDYNVSQQELESRLEDIGKTEFGKHLKEHCEMVAVGQTQYDIVHEHMKLCQSNAEAYAENMQENISQLENLLGQDSFDIVQNIISSVVYDENDPSSSHMEDDFDIDSWDFDEFELEQDESQSLRLGNKK